MTVPSLTLQATEPAEYQPEAYVYRWQNDAACRGVDPSLFFPGRGDNAAVATAKAICASCPVCKTCGDENLYEPHGVWGGMAERERQTERIKRNGSRGRNAGLVTGYNGKALRALVEMGGTWNGTGRQFCDHLGIRGGIERSLVTELSRRGLAELTYNGQHIATITITAHGLEAIGL